MEQQNFSTENQHFYAVVIIMVILLGCLSTWFQVYDYIDPSLKGCNIQELIKRRAVCAKRGYRWDL